jgi:hypothetical protein
LGEIHDPDIYGAKAFIGSLSPRQCSQKLIHGPHKNNGTASKHPVINLIVPPSSAKPFLVMVFGRFIGVSYYLRSGAGGTFWSTNDALSRDQSVFLRLRMLNILGEHDVANLNLSK